MPVGGTLTWRLRVLDDKNYGPATGVYVSVELPAGVTLASAQADRGPGCVATGQRSLRCDLDWLSSDAPYGNLTLATTVTAAGELVLRATVGHSQADANPADNTQTLRANIPVAAPPAPPKPPAAVRPVLGKPLAQPPRPLAGKRFAFTLPVTSSDDRTPLTAARMACVPTIAGKPIRHTDSFKGGKAHLSLVVPRTARGKQLKVEIEITASGRTATHIYTYKVR